MGHTHGFGSTEEPLRRTVFGCRERGLPSGPRFDHTTGEGHVPFHKGDYHDALRHKNNQVALLLVECFGGVASGGARLLRYLARRASDKKRGRDGTKYSKFHAGDVVDEGGYGNEQALFRCERFRRFS